MNTEARSITVSGISVVIDRKNIKNLHLGVYPPNGRARVAAPLKVSDEAVRLAVVGKLAWIHRQQASFQAQPRQSGREMVNCETHYFLGKWYRRRVIDGEGPSRVEQRGKTILALHAPPTRPRLLHQHADFLDRLRHFDCLRRERGFRLSHVSFSTCRVCAACTRTAFTGGGV